MTFLNSAGYSDYWGYGSLIPPGGALTGIQPQAYSVPMFAMQTYQAPGINSFCNNYGYGGAGYGGYNYPQYDYSQAQYPQYQYPPQNSDGGVSTIIGKFFNMLMMLLMTAGRHNNNAAPSGWEGPPPIDNTQQPDGAGDTTLPGGDNTQTGDTTDENQPDITGEDASSNTGALAIISAYQDQIPHHNGKITKKDLKNFLKGNPDLPADVKTAVEGLKDNDELYNLLCLKSGNSPDEGFKVSALDSDWGSLDIDNLETVSDDDVWATLRNVNDQLKAIDGNNDNGSSMADIKKVALGQVHDAKLKDPKVQAAALKFLFDQDLQDKFDKLDGTTGNGQGQITGDPHFVGEDGEHYDVMGEVGKSYNILSDRYVQFNSEFAAWGQPGADGVQPTIMGKAGIQVNHHKVELDKDSDAPTVDGTKLEVNQPKDLGNGCKATWDGTNLVVSTPQYDIKVTKSHDDTNGNYLDQYITVKYHDPANKPHGLWGQTVDSDTDQKGTGTGTDKQGGGVIDGSYSDYETGDLWGTSHNTQYNRFDPNAEYNPDGGDGNGDFN